MSLKKYIKENEQLNEFQRQDDGKRMRETMRNYIESYGLGSYFDELNILLNMSKTGEGKENEIITGLKNIANQIVQDRRQAEYEL